MYSVTKQIAFCYGHRLLDYAGKCRFLHGHNGLLEVVVEKPKLDRLGFVMDFGDISAVVKTWVDAELDHKMILSERDPMLPAMRQHEQPFVTLPGNPTAEAIAKHVFDYCRSQKLPVASVTLWETPTSHASYRD